MNTPHELLENWANGRCESIRLTDLYARDPVVHKWKAPFRALVLRESLLWRMHDLLTQAEVLHENGHTFGSRILIRCALETLATLAYLNDLMRNVVSREETYDEFSVKTSRLLLGSKNKTTKHESINVLTILKRCDTKYKGILDLYATLSETVHPNYESTCFGYSRVDHERYETNFGNYWHEMYANRHKTAMAICIYAFEAEYSDSWPPAFHALEAWIKDNHTLIEEPRDDALDLPEDRS